MAFKPAPIAINVSVEDKLTSGIQIIEALRESVYPAPERAIMKLKTAIAKEVTMDTYYDGMSPELMQLFFTMMHA
jgi:hypothetical protein